jgi:glycosyltransferase involved in cell wall biosynthesis
MRPIGRSSEPRTARHRLSPGPKRAQRGPVKGMTVRPSAARPRPLLLMAHDYPPLTGGGLALAVQELAQHLRKDFRVRVLSSRLVDHFADDRRRVLGLGASGAELEVARPWRTLRWLWEADALVVHWTFSFRRLSTTLAALSPLHRKPTICVVHTGPGHCRYNRIRHLPDPARQLLFPLARHALGHCAAVVALSRTHAAALADAGIAADHVLPLPVGSGPGYDHAYEGRARTGSAVHRLGVAGELSELKGADELPPLLERLTPEFTFHIAGDGVLAPTVARAVSSLSPEQRACVVLSALLPPERMAGFYRRVDCVLVLSRTESQCRVALEAMLAGAIVLARCAEGVSDLIVDGVTGFFIEPANPEAVRQVLRQLARAPAKMDAVRRSARLVAEERFDESRRAWTRFLSTFVA